MKRMMTVVIGFVCVFVMLSAWAKPPKMCAYLYLVSGTNGKIKQISERSYQLTMTMPTTNQVTVFSDRPYRIIKSISGLELEKTWGQAPNTRLAANPLNIVVEIADRDTKVVTLTDLQINGRQAIYTFTSTSLPSSWKKSNNFLVHITIDDSENRVC
jgi:hypothetical protein